MRMPQVLVNPCGDQRLQSTMRHGRDRNNVQLGRGDGRQVADPMALKQVLHTLICKRIGMMDEPYCHH